MIIAAIASYNDEESLFRLLRCLEEQQRRPDEVLIVDNSDIALQMEPGCCTSIPVKVIRPEKNAGWSGAYKLAFRYGRDRKADHIWFLDQDSRPDSRCLHNLVSARGAPDPSRTGIISPLVIDDDGLEVARPATFSASAIRMQLKYDFNEAGYAEIAMPITSGSLIAVDLGEIAIRGIDGMIVDAVDWIVAFNLIDHNKKNYLCKHAVVYHRLGEYEPFRKFFRLLRIRYSADRLYLQLRNTMYCLGYMSSIHPMKWTSFYTVCRGYVVDNLALVLIKRQSMFAFLRAAWKLLGMRKVYQEGRANYVTSKPGSEAPEVCPVPGDSRSGTI